MADEGVSTLYCDEVHVISPLLVRELQACPNERVSSSAEKIKIFTPEKQKRQIRGAERNGTGRLQVRVKNKNVEILADDDNLGQTAACQHRNNGGG